MSNPTERARDAIEHADQARANAGDTAARWIAMLVAVLAAAAAISELGEKSSTTTYLRRHLALTDDYAAYQEKHLRLTTLRSEEMVLLSLPNATDPGIQARIAQARGDEARLGDIAGTGDEQGMKQLQARSVEDRAVRDRAAHLAHQLEIPVGGLQIAIVLASASVVTRVRALAWGAVALGVAMSVYGALLWSGAV